VTSLHGQKVPGQPYRTAAGAFLDRYQRRAGTQNAGLASYYRSKRMAGFVPQADGPS